MRIVEEGHEDLKRRYDEELARFKELDAQKKALFSDIHTTDGMMQYIQLHREIELKWQDSAQEITHLHRKLYPYFPRGIPCSNCGSDTMPVLGSSHKADSCIACGEMRVRD